MTQERFGQIDRALANVGQSSFGTQHAIALTVRIRTVDLANGAGVS